MKYRKILVWRDNIIKLLVFQHADCDHPGSLRRFLKQDGIEWDTVELSRGEVIPDLATYDALWVMGGPMDVWDTDEHPWLVAEKAAIRTWVRGLQKPFLGLCLGHQLLADALGGECGPQKPAEIGVMEIELSEFGQTDVLMKGLPLRQKCLQWHSVQVTQTPEGAEVLASSLQCPIQVMRVGRNAWSMQYHIEVEPDTVDNWAKIPAYQDALIAALEENGLETMRAQAAAAFPEVLSSAEHIYRNFMTVAAQSRTAT